MPQTDHDELSNCREDVLRLFASYVYLTGPHIQHLTGRTQKPVERDLRFLREAKYLTYKDHPTEKFGPYVWYLTQKGWDWCFDEKLFKKRVNATDEKGTGYLRHDLVLTELHIKFHDIYGDDLYWTQLRQDCYRRYGEKKNDRVNMDAFCSFPVGNEFACFCIEVEKSRDTVKNGESARMAKNEAYAGYIKGPFQKEFGNGADFRVLWTFANETKALNHAGKCHQAEGVHKNRKIWILDEASIPKLTKETPAFITPTDVTYEPARRRFNAQRLYSLNEA
jgi:hypothetical protein